MEKPVPNQDKTVIQSMKLLMRAINVVPKYVTQRVETVFVVNTLELLENIDN